MSEVKSDRNYIIQSICLRKQNYWLGLVLQTTPLPPQPPSHLMFQKLNPKMCVPVDTLVGYIATIMFATKRLAKRQLCSVHFEVQIQIHVTLMIQTMPNDRVVFLLVCAMRDRWILLHYTCWIIYEGREPPPQDIPSPLPQLPRVAADRSKGCNFIFGLTLGIDAFPRNGPGTNRDRSLNGPQAVWE